MKGYYAIYNHKRNAWWTVGTYWTNDVPIETYHLPTNIVLTKWINSDGDQQVDLQKSDFKDIVCWNNGFEKNPYNIFVFETLKEAEDYLLGGAIYKETNEFFTIRKIYY